MNAGLSRNITPPPVTTLTFGCVPHTDNEHTRLLLQDLCHFLATKLGVMVRAHRAASPQTLASAFKAGRVDVAWVSPALFVTAPELAEARPVVCSVRQGLATYHAVLFVEERSPIRSTTELRGTRVAWVAPSSAAGYIVPRVSLAAHGLDPRGRFSSERFFDSHGNVARAVLAGEADVGATYAVFEGGDPTRPLVRAGFTDVSNGSWARILHAAGPIPSEPIVAAPRLHAALRLSLSAAFKEVERDQKARAAARHVLGAESFEPTDPGVFDVLRRDIEDARELGLLGV